MTVMENPEPMGHIDIKLCSECYGVSGRLNHLNRFLKIAL